MYPEEAKGKTYKFITFYKLNSHYYTTVILTEKLFFFQQVVFASLL